MLIDFVELRRANVARQEEWPGGGQIGLQFRAMELDGESGELANLLKKLVRLDLSIKGTTEDRGDLLERIEQEIGDVMICLDLVGMQIGEKIDPAAGVGMLPARDADMSKIERLQAESNWLSSCVGDVCGGISTGLGEMVGDALSMSFWALVEVAELAGVNLWLATMTKFNMTSRKHGFKTMMEDTRQ